VLNVNSRGLDLAEDIKRVSSHPVHPSLLSIVECWHCLDDRRELNSRAIGTGETERRPRRDQTADCRVALPLMRCCATG